MESLSERPAHPRWHLGLEDGQTDKNIRDRRHVNYPCPPMKHDKTQYLLCIPEAYNTND